MPDNQKISESPAATLPLSGTELVAIVQGGLNKNAPASAFGMGGTIAAEDVSVDDSLYFILSGADAQTLFDNLDDYLNAQLVTGLDSVLTVNNEANGLDMVEMSGINNSIYDFELQVSDGNVDFYFGNSPGGVFGLEAFADQMFFNADQWYALSSDSNMYILMDIDLQYVELGNQSNYLRVTEFDIEVGSPILGYSTTSDMQSYVTGLFSSAAFKKDRVKARTTAALESCTVGGSNTTLTKVGNGAFPNQDGIAFGLQQDLLVNNQADPKQNGIYSLSQPGGGGTPWILTRRSDSNPGTDMTAAIYNVEQGTRFKNTCWRQTTLNPVLGTDNVIFVPFGDNIIEDTVSGYYKIVSTSGVLSTTSV